MGTIKSLADAAWRDDAIAGVPGSGPNNASKSEIRSVFAQVDTLDARITAIEGADHVPVLVRATWAALAPLTGTTAGQRAEVTGTDAGTHTDPVVGGTVANEGIYSWSASPAGWQRVHDRDTAAAVRADLGTNPNGNGAAPSAFARIVSISDGLDSGLTGWSASTNLLNPENPGALWGSFVNNSNGTVGSGDPQFVTSGRVAIIGGNNHVVSVGYADSPWYIQAAIVFYDTNGAFLSSIGAGDIISLDVDRTFIFSTPADARYLQFNCLRTDASPTADQAAIMLHLLTVQQSSALLPFEAYRAGYAPGRAFRKLAWATSGSWLYVSQPYSQSKDIVYRYTVFEVADSTLSGSVSPVSETLVPRGTRAKDLEAAVFRSVELLRSGGDDGPPLWINGTILGAGHGLESKHITKTGHGKTNVDVGSKWTDGASKVWILYRVDDADTLSIAPALGGTSTLWTIDTALTGTTLTHASGATHTAAISSFTSPTAIQIHPWLQLHKVQVLADGEALKSGCSGYADKIVVTDGYAIPNAKAVEDFLVGAVGNAAAPVYAPDLMTTQVRIEITYTFRPGELQTVNWSLFNDQNYTRDITIGMQSAPSNRTGSDKLYLFVPGVTTETTSGLNFRNVAEITSLASLINISGSEVLSAANKPATFAQIVKSVGGTPKFGQILHYSPLFGSAVPATRQTLTDNVLMMAAGGKMYLYVVDALLGATALANEFFEVSGARGSFDASQDSRLTISGVYTISGKKYWVAASHASFTNAWIPLPYGLDLRGRPIALLSAMTEGTVTLRSSVISDRGVMMSVAGGYGFWIAEIG